MLKSEIEVHKSCSNSIFRVIFWDIIPVLYSQKKTIKYLKKRYLGPMSQSKLC
jgi:hypothetical protein